MGRWGSAEERLTASQQRQRHEQDDEHCRQAENYQRWRHGQVVPHRITTALDLRSLQGPEVDRQCHAREPEVDEWERGQRYPRWDQLLALAELTEFPPGFFFLPIEPIPYEATSLGCRRSGGFTPPTREPVLEYDPAVVEATVNPRQPGLF